MKKYRTIVIDPPWHYGAWGATALWLRPNSKKRPLPFPTMSVDEIKQLDVCGLADENCELYLWTTQRYLPNAFDVLRAWGFKYCQTLTWCKNPRCGLGGAYTPTTEFLLLGRRGKKPRGVKRILTTWFLVKRPHNNHSAKPEEFQTMIEMVTESPRLEMFARRKRQGWDVWGNEVESDIELPSKEYLHG